MCVGVGGTTRLDDGVQLIDHLLRGSEGRGALWWISRCFVELWKDRSPSLIDLADSGPDLSVVHGILGEVSRLFHLLSGLLELFLHLLYLIATDDTAQNEKCHVEGGLFHSVSPSVFESS